MRKLGYWENLFFTAHEKFSGAGLILGLLPYQGTLNIDICHQALLQIYLAHPALRNCIKEIDNEIYFVEDVQFANIPFEVRKQEDWQGVANTFEDQQLPIDQYLWKLTIIDNDTHGCIIVVIHHAIADGNSILQILTQLLKNYEALIQQTQLPESQPYKFLSLGSYLQTNLTLEQKKLIDQEINQEILNAQITPWPYEKTIAFAERKSGNLFWQLESSDLKTLIQTCKNKNITVGIALNTAALLACAKLKKSNLNLLMANSIDMRERGTQPVIAGSQIGCYIALATTIHKNINEHTDFWTLANEFKEQLPAAIAKQANNPAIENLDSADLANYFSEKLPIRDSFIGAMNISNVGRVQLQSHFANISVDGLYFGNNRRYGNWVMLISVLTVNDKMCVNFNYATPNISNDTARQFVDLFVAELSTHLLRN